MDIITDANSLRDQMITRMYMKYPKCKCSKEQIYHIKHSCILRNITEEFINDWFFRDETELYSLRIEIAYVMSMSILDPSYDYNHAIKLLEKRYSRELPGFQGIIEDYKRWYSSRSSTSNIKTDLVAKDEFIS